MLKAARGTRGKEGNTEANNNCMLGRLSSAVPKILPSRPFEHIYP